MIFMKSSSVASRRRIAHACSSQSLASRRGLVSDAGKWRLKATAYGRSIHSVNSSDSIGWYERMRMRMIEMGEICGYAPSLPSDARLLSS